MILTKFPSRQQRKRKFKPTQWVRMTGTLVLVLSLLLPTWAAPAHAVSRHGSNVMFSVYLSGDQEVGNAGDLDGNGHVNLMLDFDNSQLCFELGVENIGSPTRAHIHHGVKGFNGGVAAFLFDAAIDPPIPVPDGLMGCSNVPQDVLKRISTYPAEYYVNIHNDEFPAGAIRGQLAHTLVAVLSGDQEVGNAGDPDGHGMLNLTLDAAQETICYYLGAEDIAPPTRAHIHRGEAGVNGGIEVFLFDTVIDKPIPVPADHAACVHASQDIIHEIGANPAGFYINIHNDEFPAGAIRGQLSQNATVFKVKIENISGKSDLPSPFSPGAWAVHPASVMPFFDLDTPDRGEGLEAIAEDGNPGQLAETLANSPDIWSSGVFNTPKGGDGPAPIFPGQSYQFYIKTDSTDAYFSLASMLVQTNDIFVGPDANGIPLFNENGTPIYGDVTDQMPFWDAGTEVNEAPGMGPNQAPRQAPANTGPGEGGVSAFTNTTHGLPMAGDIVDVEIAETDGTFTFTIHNLDERDAIRLGLSPLFYATHNANWRLLTPGKPASDGVEVLAEDGNAQALVDEHTGAPGTGMVGATAGPAGPGEAFVIEVTPTSRYPYLNIATMLVETNDAFLAFGPKGIRLLDYAGHPRPVEHILADWNRMLAVWDAGTEVNETVGGGPNRATQQPAANTGPDENGVVHLYRDHTNDLHGVDADGNVAGGFAHLSITHSDTDDDSFVVKLTNTSGGNPYQGVLTPAAYAIHDDDYALFQVGQDASPGLELISEDGNPATLIEEMNDADGVFHAGVAAIPEGAGGPGPLTDGHSYIFEVTPDEDYPYLTIASMVVPSNDTFLAFGPHGIRLLDEDDDRRSEADIAADIAAELIAWDAGTERNQAGAWGPDQPPRQDNGRPAGESGNIGADEGNGLVRLLDDTVWDYPEASEVVRISIYPVKPGIQLPEDTPLPADAPYPPTTFKVRLENISGESDLPGPFSPGAWAVHKATRPFFTNNKPDRGEGLAAIAEDGNPGPLAMSLAHRYGVSSSGVFNTPVGADSPGPIFPGQAYEFYITTTPKHARLSLATMLVQTNDIFAGPGGAGIKLFHADGTPISGDITHLLPFWDVGSEMNEAPGMGPNQAPRQPAANTGPYEGGVSAFTNTTRALPLAGAMEEVEITEDNGTFTFTMHNVSPEKGAIVTPLSPLFYATHNANWRLFTTGENASPGLEALAEDGGAPALVTEHDGADGIGSVGATDGPAGPGGQFSFSVTPTDVYPYLTIATMVVESNDAFLAFGPHGIRLLDADGNQRSLDDILADWNRMLAVWDAGTEANEVPGVGPYQVLRQGAGSNIGPDDPHPGVRIYSDHTNDLAGGFANGFANMSIEHGPHDDSFIVTISNTSGGSAYPGALTPVAWATHNRHFSLFQVGEHASPGLESLSEDGAVATLLGELRHASGVAHSGAVAVRSDGTGPGPLHDGESYRFIVTPSKAYPYLSTAQMIVPSNDTFLAFGPHGIRLLDEEGNRRSEEDIAADIAHDLIAWDAGTERNQAGAAGPDQAPRQADANTGASEGPGTVRLLHDPVWDYPEIGEVLKATIMPVENPVVYVSSSTSGQVADIHFDDEDILAYNRIKGTWSKIFDASDFGFHRNDLNALHVKYDGTILMSFSGARTVDGVGEVDDSDIVKFVPTALGEETAGHFEMHFDGSDVGLSSSGEDIDSIAYTPDGYLVISTIGSFSVSGISSGRDEDLILFKAESFGDETAGTWERLFDGSDVDLRRSSEDVRGASISHKGNIYLTTKGDYEVAGLEGDGDDIFTCMPGSLGSDTSCDFSLFWDGDDAGFGDEIIDGFSLGTPVTARAVAAATVQASSASVPDEVDSDEEVDAEEAVVDDVNDEQDTDSDHAVDDVTVQQSLENELFLPLVNR